MTELAVREETTTHLPAPAAQPPVQVFDPAQQSALVRWTNEARQAGAVAASLAKTSFVPASLRGKPEDIMAAILAGQELGLQPMATLRSMDVIQGTPALRAHAMRGLVQSKGHSVQLVEASDSRVVMRGRRRGEREWQEVEWTTERAAKLGLTGKSEWRKQPKTMLIARATGEMCRLVASDVIYAMPYAAEELDGTETPDGFALGAPRVTAEEILGQPSAEPHAIAAAAADPGSSCGWCEQPGHHEDECPQRDEADYSDAPDGGA